VPKRCTHNPSVTSKLSDCPLSVKLLMVTRSSSLLYDQEKVVLFATVKLFDGLPKGVLSEMARVTDLSGLAVALMHAEHSRMPGVHHCTPARRS